MLTGRSRKRILRRLSRAHSAAVLRGPHPARTVTGSFLVLITLGTCLLLIPNMTASGRSAPLGDALFTAVSASCVTGLIVVDTATFWSPLGKFVILVLIQVGGFGIMTLGSLAVILVSRRVGLQTRLATSKETGTLELGALRSIITGLALITVTAEAVVALMLTARLWLHYPLDLGQAAWMGIFHSISAFNNAGFALSSQSLIPFRSDALILGPISIAIVVGGLGFPVLIELARRARGGRVRILRRRLRDEEVAARAAHLAGPERYGRIAKSLASPGLGGPIPLSLHTRLMLWGTTAVIFVGFLGFALFEWRNPLTLGDRPIWERLLQSFFSGSITPRTAGFNTVRYSQVTPETRFMTDGLMLIGGGSASTAGGIKVTTLVVLIMAVIAETRGHRDVNALDRRIPFTTVRIALSVTMISVAAVMLGTLAMMELTDMNLDLAMFEVISALATVGLSAEATQYLPEPGQVLLMVLMFLGRVGPITLVSALSLRSSERRFRLPEGRPLIG